MNEKRMREDIIRRVRVANAQKLSAIWYFTRGIIDLTEREDPKKKHE